VSTPDADVLVVGAGPHGLAVCTYLLSERRRDRPRLLAVDRQGWMTQWSHRLSGLGVLRLRSSCVHHPDPDPCALIGFARRLGRDAEMTGEFNLPTAGLFADLCSELVGRHGLHEVLIPQHALRLRCHPDGAAVQLEDGCWLRVRRVVLATNPSVPRLPSWARALLAARPEARIAHSDDVRLNDVTEGERILVVGGGLTAVQLTLAAAARGALPLLASRARLREQDFDVRPGWFTYRLARFHLEPRWDRRAATLRAERSGSVPPDELRALRDAAARGSVEIHESCAVQDLRWTGDHGEALLGGETRPFDRVWLATGHRFHVGAQPLLSELCHSHPTRVVAGLPVLDRACGWPGTAVHLMGGLAGLQLGPVARNVAGARMGAERIAATLGRRAALQYPMPPAESAGRQVTRLRRRGAAAAPAGTSCRHPAPRWR
jgi:hypothetical protein